MSNRGIADAIGVSDMTVGRALKASSATNDAVDLGRYTVGKDGIARPARRKIVDPAPVALGLSVDKHFRKFLC